MQALLKNKQATVDGMFPFARSGPLCGQPLLQNDTQLASSLRVVVCYVFVSYAISAIRHIPRVMFDVPSLSRIMQMFILFCRISLISRIGIQMSLRAAQSGNFRIWPMFRSIGTTTCNVVCMLVGRYVVSPTNQPFKQLPMASSVVRFLFTSMPSSQQPVVFMSQRRIVSAARQASSCNKIPGVQTFSNVVDRSSISVEYRKSKYPGKFVTDRLLDMIFHAPSCFVTRKALRTPYLTWRGPLKRIACQPVSPRMRYHQN